MEQENFFIENKSILSFFILELIALIAFNFGNISHALIFVGALLAILGTFILLKITSNKKGLLPLLIPVGLLTICSVIAATNGYSKIDGKFGFSDITLLLAIPSFFMLGFLVKSFKDTKTSSVILVIGAALGAITLFGLFSTLISYGFYYKVIYKNSPNYYYCGSVFDVTKEMYWLSGFEFKEVSINYGSLFALLSACYLPGLLFVNHKENKNEFLAMLAIGLVGLLTLIVIPNVLALIVLVVASVGALIFKYFSNNKKLIKTIKIGLFVLAGLALIFFVLAIINVGNSYKFPGILNRIFVQNGIMQKVNPVLEAAIKGKNLFGLQPLLENENVIYQDSGVFEVQLLKELGIIGTVVFILFLVFMLVKLFSYLKNSDDPKSVKAILMTLIFGFFIYESIANTIAPYTHEEIIMSFLGSPILYVMIFLLGFMFTCEKKEGK